MMKISQKNNTFYICFSLCRLHLKAWRYSACTILTIIIIMNWSSVNKILILFSIMRPMCNVLSPFIIKAGNYCREHYHPNCLSALFCLDRVATLNHRTKFWHATKTFAGSKQIQLGVYYQCCMQSDWFSSEKCRL